MPYQISKQIYIQREAPAAQLSGLAPAHPIINFCYGRLTISIDLGVRIMMKAVSNMLLTSLIEECTKCDFCLKSHAKGHQMASHYHKNERRCVPFPKPSTLKYTCGHTLYPCRPEVEYNESVTPPTASHLHASIEVVDLPQQSSIISCTFQ